MWGNDSGTIQDRRHQTQEQEEEGRTTTRTTITRHKGKEAKRNGSKPERCSSCVLWGGGVAPLFLFRPNTYRGTCMSIEHSICALQGSRGSIE